MISKPPRPSDESVASGRLARRHSEHAVVERSEAPLSGRARALASLLPGYLAYSLFHVVAAPVLVARAIARGRRGRYRGVFWNRLLGGSRPPERAPWVLIVGSALGETRTALAAATEISTLRQVPAAMLSQLPAQEFENVTRQAAVPVGHAPFNSPLSVLVALLRWRPQAVLFVEFSGNYHFAFMARLLGARTAVINVNLPEDRCQRLQRKPISHWQFHIPEFFAVQAGVHRDRLERLRVDPHRVRVLGLGLGRLRLADPESMAVREHWRALLMLGKESPVFVAGSTYPGEESEILTAFSEVLQREPDARLILAPRHLDRSGGIEGPLQASGLPYSRRSQGASDAPVMLLDTVGELRDAYSIACGAFVGGSMIKGIGGHTPLEPLGWGVPIQVGPHVSQQEAAVAMCAEAGVLQTVLDADALTQAWMDLILRPQKRAEIRVRAQALVESAHEAYARTFDALLGEA